MTKTFYLRAEPRVLTGKKAKRLLRQGLVPGALYDSKGQSQPVQFSERELLRVLHEAGTTHLIELEIDGKRIPTLLREVDREPITTRIRHVSLWAMPMDKPIETEVPITFTGESGALRAGGMLIHPVEKLTVRCLPRDIPEAIVVDLSALREFGDSIHVRDLVLPPGVQVLDNPDETVATVAAPKVAVEEEVAEEITAEATLAE
jgi:large subunit ribosomal protein L25